MSDLSVLCVPSDLSVLSDLYVLAYDDHGNHDDHRICKEVVLVKMLGKVVNFGPDEDLILGSLMSHPHCTLLLDDAGMRRMTLK